MMLKYWTRTFIVISVLAHGTAHAQVSSEIYCSEELARRNLDCPQEHNNPKYFRQLIKKEYTAEQVRENLKRDVPRCKGNLKDIPRVFTYAPQERDQKRLADLLEEIAALNGPAPEKVLGAQIKNKTANGWQLALGQAEIFLGNDALLQSFEEELRKLKGTRPKKVSHAKPANIPELRGEKFRPQHVLKVENGWLLGSDKGEWGGDLIFLDADQKATVLINDNVLGLFDTPAGHVAVTGLAHMTFNYGYLFQLENNGKQWSAHPFATLYGAPQLLQQTPDGTLLIANDFGSFRLGKDGLCRLTEIDGK